MKKVRGEHPRDPGTKIQIKPYYDYEVSRELLSPSGKWGSTSEYEDACIRITEEARGLVKGKRASLVIPRDKDPETGGYFDCDGTRSREFVEMHIVSLIVLERRMTVEGFVALGDWYNDDPDAFQFAYERWDQTLRDRE